MANSNRETNTSYDGMGNSSRNLETYDASGRLDSVTASGDTLNLAYNGVGELARTELTRPDACTNAVFTLAIDDFVFTPDGHALHVRTANTAAVSVDYVWLDDLPVAQFQDSYDAQGVYIGTEATYLHSDHLGTPRIGTNASKQITWRNRSDAFGIAELSGSAVVRLRFPGQLSLGVAGLNYNYYRDYDPKVGRYLESDPIGLDGGLNTYGYVGQNPARYFDLHGLERWDFDGPGDISVCKYYDQQANENPNCGYYKEAAKICRSENRAVNTLTTAGLFAAYATSSSFTDSQSVVVNKIRNNLIKRDAAARAASADACGCPPGDDIDAYHNDVFREAGLSRLFYGGNWAPQNSLFNPVPYDPRRFDPVDDSLIFGDLAGREYKIAPGILAPRRRVRNRGLLVLALDLVVGVPAE